jgi:hypothetical protein
VSFDNAAGDLVILLFGKLEASSKVARTNPYIR